MTDPAAPPRPRRVSLVGLVVLGGIALLGAVLVFNGAKMLVQRQTGERVQATVTSCVGSGRARNSRTDCVGSWTSDGALRRGKIQGATSDQVGKVIDVTVEGDTAYSRHIGLPLMLVGLGLLPLALGIALLRGMLKKPAAAPAEPAA
ncbi:MAG TPA: hypothetical protein VNA14_11980 [Mycobacteriales bacterium]|nr:hypothetical protein [Mycobacteriales bacterium]